MSGRNNGPLKVDGRARELFGRAAMAVGMCDKELALEVCKHLLEVEEHYELRLRCSVEESAANAHASTKFTGRPMHSKYPGKCCVCGADFGVDSAILYNGELKKAAHQSCGEIAE